MFRHVKKLHFVGIGGIGMSGIAELLLNQGFKISGSDINDSKVIQNLKNKGAKIFKGHDSKNLSNADVLVYSSAVKEDNPEIIAITLNVFCFKISLIVLYFFISSFSSMDSCTDFGESKFTIGY